MIEGHSLEQESSTERLRVAVVGKEKHGKSWLIATAPGNTLILDYDQRAASLAGRKGVFASTFKDPQWPKMPEVAEETLDVISCLESSLDLSKLTSKNKKLLPTVPEGTLVDNVAVDSTGSLAQCVMRYELYNSPALRRDLKIGPNMEVHIPKSFDAWKAEMDAVGAIIMRLFALPINIFCTFHEADEEANDSTDEKPRYTGRTTIYPVRYRGLLKYFNEVWRVKLTPIPSSNGVRYLPRVYPLPDFAFDSATTMLLDAVEEPNIAQMISKHEKEVKSRGGLNLQSRSGVTASIPIAGISK
jgi:AAA domain